MTRSTFRVLFYANGSKEKNGTVPIMDGLQSTERWRSSVASGASQKNFGMQRATVPKVGSLLGSGKLKELEADNRTLQNEVAARDESIELLQRQMQRQQEEHSRQLMELQAKHRREMADKEAAHQEEVSFLKSVIQKAKKWFPLFQELVYMEKFCLKVGFNEKQTATLISGKPLFYEGELYSEEHKRKFKTERAGFQVVKDPKDKSKLALAINRQLIGEWFKEQFNKLFSSIRRTVAPHRKDKGLGL